ncbi:MAG: hypothetical protein NPIRA01_28290 [Nitrospirales bacterium]|nr:MAG: hypothetical protein NPIRA01_28290 [Nitrospirales bacterium]
MQICRADITQYTIWHKRHTEPLAKTGKEPGPFFWEVDVKALSELVGLLFLCYQNTGRASEFPGVLNRLYGNIKDSRWHAKIVYFRALSALGRNWNRESGRRELKKIGRIENINDLEILKLFLDLFGEELSFSVKQKVISRVLDHSEKSIDTLYYRFLRGVQYLLINDHEGAEKEIEEAIDDFRKERKESLEIYEKHCLAMSSALLALLKSDEALYKEARSLWESILEVYIELPSAGKADIYRWIGGAFEYQKKWEEALESYLHGIKFSDNGILRIFISRCHLELDNIGKAREYLDSVSVEDLMAAELADYAFVDALLSIGENNKENIERSENLLINIKLEAPYFRDYRYKLLLSLDAAKNSSETGKILKKSKEILAGLFRSVNQYVILQPNIMGVGINLNKVLENISSGSKQHQEQGSTNLSEDE